jgi:hypothetical protein
MMMYISLQRPYVRKNISISSDGRCTGDKMYAARRSPRSHELSPKPMSPYSRKQRLASFKRKQKRGFDSAGQLCHGRRGIQAPGAACLCHFQSSQSEYCQIETLLAYRLQEQTRLFGSRTSWLATSLELINSITWRITCRGVCPV